MKVRKETQREADEVGRGGGNKDTQRRRREMKNEENKR